MTATINRPDSETERQSRREAIRERIAQAQMVWERSDLLGEEVAAIDARLDAAADVHRETCEPLQQELERLEKLAIRRIADRQPADENEDSRRREIVGEIAEANQVLEEIVQKEKALKEPLQKEISKLRREHLSPKNMALQLAHPSVASPELLQEQFRSQQNIKWANARLKAAKSALKIVSHNAKEISDGRMGGDLVAQRRKVENWQSELDAAEQAIADALGESNRIHSEMINED